MRLGGLSLGVLVCSACAAGSGAGGDGGGGVAMDAAEPDAGGMDGAAADGPGDATTTDDAGAPVGDGGAVDGGSMRECAAEVCDDGFDNDCDGVVDEDCACEPGTVASCFRGDPLHHGLGLCRDGTMVCTGSAEFGTWSPCEGDVVESMEVCDAAGLDEDCDGAPNDGCDCAPGDPDLPCGLEMGECIPGVQRCVGGVRLDCEGATLPAPESCDGLDNDCDGLVDEGLMGPCGTDTGACRMGTETCTAGVWGPCLGGTAPSPEVCDSLDNDCDGLVDETVDRACGMDVGACMAGTQVCSAGSWGLCSGRVDPTMELCNGIDDDCNGLVDDGVTRPCGTDVGVCRAGIETCVAGAWGTCAGAIMPGTELCDGVNDEDCDGTVDEGCGCTSGATLPCGSDVGQCSLGLQSCDTAGAWGACTGGMGPAPEICDGLDNDCDGLLDEGCDCITGAMRSCGSSVGACMAGSETCDGAGRWGACLGGVGPTPEVCNSIDDDCDGATDEGGVCPTFPPTVMCPGATTTDVGAPATLTGSGADPDGGAVSFAWTVVTAPLGSSAAPASPSSPITSFAPDLPGTYTLRLCVTDPEPLTSCCTTVVTATSTCTPPTVPLLTGCSVSWDRRPIVEFAPLPSGVSYELYKDADVMPYATVSAVGQNYYRPPAALGAGGPPPSGTAMTIYAKACLVADPACCSVGAPVTAALIESCTTPVTPSASNIVFSEYVTNGDGSCPGPDCEAGEAIEITNLSNCPVALDGNHFGYCNPGSCGAFRWMNFGPTDIVPPRGVYIAIRNRAASMCAYPFFGPDDPGLFGLKISTLAMQGTGLTSGWFNNSGGGMSKLRIATGGWTSITGGTTLELVAPYLGSAPECSSIGFDALDACGNISPVATPTMRLTPNQLGRLWHPCDAVLSPVPATCR